MENMTPHQPTSEEKFWAVLSHLSVFAGGIGLIIPAYGWAENRRKSNYAAFQSLQALGYQSIGYTLWALAYLLVLILLFVVTVPLLPNPGQDVAGYTGMLGNWLGIHLLAILGLYGVYMLFPLAGAVMCAFGRDFRYPWLGNRLASYIAYNSGSAGVELNEQHEERFAVSMGHFCVIFPLTGLLVPVALWSTQGARSRYMKFQALQTIVFQAVGTLVFLALGAIALVILVAAIVPFILALNTGRPPIESFFAIFVFLICLAVIVLVIPLFQVLGQWAGLRVLQGHNYRYPLIGRWVENRLAKREVASAPEKNASLS